MDTSQTSTSRTQSVALADGTAPAAGEPLAILHQLARDLASPPELDIILRNALLAAVQLTGAQHATLLLLDQAGEQIRYRVALDNGNLAPLDLVAKPMMTKGLAGWVARAHHTAVVSDTEQDPRWLPGPGLGDLRSALVTPLICAGRALGVLTLASETPDYFEPAHIQQIEILAAQAASTIELAQREKAGPAPALEDETAQQAQRPSSRERQGEPGSDDVGEPAEPMVGQRSPAAPTPPARAQDTVALAAELRGLSAAAAKLGPAICFAEVLDVYAQTLALIVHRYNGMMVQTAGDTLLAVFEWAGDGARVARAALELHETARRLAERWQARLGIAPVPLNIGLARGPALIGRIEPREGTCAAVGTVVSQAERLRELARPGEILVAEEIGLMLTGAEPFELIALPPLQLGGALKQQIYRLRPASAP